MKAEATLESAGVARHIAFRPLRPTDVHFILDSWLKSYRDSDEAQHVSYPVFRHGHHDVAAKLLQRCGAVVAAYRQTEEQILGWCVAESVGQLALVHYVYVKHPFRRWGIAHGLVVEATPGATAYQHTHHTRGAAGLSRRFRSTLNPYAR